MMNPAAMVSLILVILMIATVLAACGKTTTETTTTQPAQQTTQQTTQQTQPGKADEKPKEDQPAGSVSGRTDINLCIPNDFVSTNAHSNRTVAELTWKTQVYEALYHFNENTLEFEPRLANLVMAEIAEMGLRDIHINASSLFDVHEPLVAHMQNGVVTGLETAYMSKKVGDAVCAGILQEPVRFYTHGGRADAIMSGRSHIDVAFIAASTADNRGNCTGRIGPSAFGALAYPVADALKADKVVVITDCLVPYPLTDPSIEETQVDYVVRVEEIGDPAGVASGITRITSDPVALYIARLAADVMEACGYVRDGLSFQTGAGGATLATAMYLHRKMKQHQICGSFALGGITGYIVDMFRDGCFEKILDTQCFDLRAVESLREDPRHLEISTIRYASPSVRSAAVNSLDVVILGATQIDTGFNVNVHTTSDGRIMGGSGGHTDCAAGAKLSMILSPLIRQRLPMVVDQVNCISTPGELVDVFVSQYGIAVNPQRKELAELLSAKGLPVLSMDALKQEAEKICGIPRQIQRQGRPVAIVLDRSGQKQDEIRSMPM